MPRNLTQLRLAAVNIDGVLLSDTFSPVIRNFIVNRGGTYTAEVERAVFSRPQLVAARAISDVLGLSWEPQDVLKAYFEERAAYTAEHPVELLDGAVELLHRLRSLGLRTVCYGGLDKRHFDEMLGGHAELFDGPGYVSTNDFRPGIREIANEAFGLAFDQVLFIDDVASVAEAARALDVAFIGHPSSYQHGFQAQLMDEAGVRHKVASLAEIDEPLLRLLDEAAAAGASWRQAPTTAA